MIDWFQCHASYTRVLLLRDLYFWWPYFLRGDTTSCPLYRCNTLLRFKVASYRRIFKHETEFAARKYFLAWESFHFHSFSVLGPNTHILNIPCLPPPLRKEPANALLLICQSTVSCCWWLPYKTSLDSKQGSPSLSQCLWSPLRPRPEALPWQNSDRTRKINSHLHPLKFHCFIPMGGLVFHHGATSFL